MILILPIFEFLKCIIRRGPRISQWSSTACLPLLTLSRYYVPWLIVKEVCSLVTEGHVMTDWPAPLFFGGSEGRTVQEIKEKGMTVPRASGHKGPRRLRETNGPAL